MDAQPARDILARQSGGLLQITLSRPQACNRLTRALVRQLRDLLDDATADRELRALVLTGEGDAFCAGAEREELSAGPMHAVAARELDDAWEGVCSRLESFPGLAVARVNGTCELGGLSLAMACDLRIAHPAATFACAALEHHVLPTEGDVARMRALAGGSRLRAMTLAGRRLDAGEALAAGLVDAVAGEDDLDDLVRAFCAPALAADADEVVAVKRLCSSYADYAVVDLCYRAMYEKEASAARRLRED